MTKYKVPDGMLKAACDDWSTQQMTIEGRCRTVLEAALRWLAENAWKPSQKECLEMERIYREADETEEAFLEIAEYVQRCMFLAEPEVPEELKDLLTLGHDETLRTTIFDYNRRILEAYKRGQKNPISS